MITGRVLLLNFSYEPLGTVGVARAMCLWFRNVISVEEYDGENVLHSPRQTFQVPSVIRLRHYVNVHRRRRETTMKRARIYIRDRYRCQYCGLDGMSNFENSLVMTVDFVVPRARKGGKKADNLVAACRACNVIKGHRAFNSLEEAKAYVLKRRAELRQEWEGDTARLKSPAMSATP